MRESKITRMVEEIIAIEYIAEDGTVFTDQRECQRYEKSALVVTKQKLKRLNKNDLSEYEFFDFGSDDYEIEIFDIQTTEDLDNLKKYLYLRATLNHGNHVNIERQLKNLNSCGHEIIIRWAYDLDMFWFYGDGSIDGYANYLREKLNNMCTENKD